MDQGHSHYIPLWLERGAGKTNLAIAWAARQLTEFDTPKLIVADHNWASLKDQLFRPLMDGLARGGYGATYSSATMQGRIIARREGRAVESLVIGMTPQRSELKVKGLRYEAAVLENVDQWPIVDGPDGVGLSVLAEEIMAWTFGPILFTFADEGRLPEPLRTAMSKRSGEIRHVAA